MTRISSSGVPGSVRLPTESGSTQTAPTSASTPRNTASAFETTSSLGAQRWQAGYASSGATRSTALFGLPPVISGPLNGLLDALDVGKNIDQLKPGDSYQLAAGANAHVEFGGEASGQLSVNRNANGSYQVSAGGEVGAGVYAQVGAQLGIAGASANGNATVGLGAGTELTFATGGDAKRGASILERMAFCASNPALANLPGMRPSKDDLKFLADHVSALELHGKVAADVAGSLGVGKDHLGAAIGGSVGANLSPSVRLELDHGKPTGLAVAYDGSAQVSAGGGAGLTLDGGKKGAAVESSNLAGFQADGQASEDVRVEAHFALPQGVNVAHLIANPKATLGKIAGQVSRSEKDTVTFDLQAQGSITGVGAGGRRAQLQLSGHLPDILRSGALASAQTFDFDKAAAQAKAKGVQVQGSLQDFHDSGPNVSFEVSVMGVGGGVQAAAVRRNYSAALRQYPAPAPAKPPQSGLISWMHQHLPWLAG